MARGIYLVFSKPVSPDREAEYNEWYDKVHIPYCLTIPGWNGATRYRQVDPGGPDQADLLGGRQYMSIYDFEAPILQDPLKAARTEAAKGNVEMSEALEMNPRPYSILYEPY
jgi:hypothetical protein